MSRSFVHSFLRSFLVGIAHSAIYLALTLLGVAELCL